MTEQALKKYFDNELSTENLVLDLQGSQVKTGYDTTEIYIESLDDNIEYNITRDHLIKLVDDLLNDHLSIIDLNTVANALAFSEYFTWQNSESNDFEIIDTIIFDWGNPGIGFPLTIENLKLWKEYLKTGVYKLDSATLRGKTKHPRHNTGYTL